MAAGWETLKVACEGNDFSLATSTLLQELEFEDPTDLLPLLCGVLTEVICRADEVESKAHAIRARKGSAFSRFAAPQAAAGDDDDGEKARSSTAAERKSKARESLVSGARRWKRTLRTLFNFDASAAAITDLEELYQSDEFSRAAAALNREFEFSEKNFTQRNAEIDNLCRRATMPIASRYGFTQDDVGVKDMRAKIEEVTQGNHEMLQLKAGLNKMVVEKLPNFRSALRGQLNDD
mmetsp:Transcript_94329/g.236820  ORF Transcript_94329/g.236820 Transcript_94329/m.236820 type:complete len:236 (+) Transcript_94329:56-763(+)